MSQLLPAKANLVKAKKAADRKNLGTEGVGRPHGLGYKIPTGELSEARISQMEH